MTNTSSVKHDKMKKKISALLAMTTGNGASEQEALTAMDVANRLMAEHGITMEDVKASTPNDFVSDTINEMRKKLHEVDLYVTGSIARFCDVKYYRDYSVKGAMAKFFGYGVDVELVKYIREMCRFAMEYEWTIYHGLYQGSTHGRTLRKSFMIGMANRLTQRLNELKAKNVPITGTALISLKNQVVEQAFVNHNKDLKLRGGAKTKFKINDAYHAGTVAGDRVNLNRKMEQGYNSNIKLLA